MEVIKLAEYDSDTSDEEIIEKIVQKMKIKEFIQKRKPNFGS